MTYAYSTFGEDEIKDEDLDDKQPEFISVAAIRARGWGPAMIPRFLGEPHRLAPNPHYKSAPAMRLYYFERVLEEERKQDVRAALEVAAERRRVRKRVAQAQTQQLLLQVEYMDIDMRPCTRKRLLDAVIAAYNNYHWESDVPASVDSDEAFLNRIQVNYARHELTLYDSALEAVARRVGVRAAEDAIREKIYAAIKEAYPDLSDECDAQLERRR